MTQEELRHLANTTNTHQQIWPNSCVQCSTEFILKIHSKIQINEYPIQQSYKDPHEVTAAKFGFPEFQKELNAHELNSYEDHLTALELLQKGIEQYNLGRPVVFSHQAQNGNFHMFTILANQESEPMVFSFAENNLIAAPTFMETLRNMARKRLGHKFHTFFHVEPKKV